MQTKGDMIEHYILQSLKSVLPYRLDRKDILRWPAQSNIVKTFDGPAAGSVAADNGAST